MDQKIITFSRRAIFVNILGILFSGLVFPVLAMVFYPQPAWQGPTAFIAAYHPLQTATFFCGFPLVIGSLLTFAGLYASSDEENKLKALSALIINALFTVIVMINYIIQTTYVPYLATHHPPETHFILPGFCMANPGSLAWALEMYGWGGIGLSFIFMAGIFRESKTERMLKYLFLANGICSVSSALITSLNMNWIFSAYGLTALVVWNGMVLVIDFYLLHYFKKEKP